MNNAQEPTSTTATKFPYTVCVEGNIGSGKSTYLQRCENRRDVEVIYEPVNEWMDMRGTNMLANLYADPGTWGMAFQTYATLTMLQGHLKTNGSPIKVMERSLLSARHCFVEAMQEAGNLRQEMYDVLQEWYDFIDVYHQPSVDLIIYLRTTPQVAFERLQRRARPEENSVTLQYLTRLHELHETWIQNEQMTKGTPTVIIDADDSLVELEEMYKTSIDNMIQLAMGPPE